MPVINHVKKEINAKIVYFGQPFAGKTTSVNYIHSKLKPDCRGELKNSGSRDERLHFFDFMPHEIGSIDGYRVRFHIYTITGAVASPATWKMVLKGADGVVFVADATLERLEGNRNYLELLRTQLEISGRLPADFPLVVQFNKNDLVPQETLEDATRFFREQGLETTYSSATRGDGVLSAISSLVKKIMRAIRNEGVQVLEPEPIEDDEGNSSAVSTVGKFRDEDFFAGAGIGVDVTVTQPGTAVGGMVALAGAVERVADSTIALPIAITLDNGTRIPLRITLSIDIAGKE